MIFNSLPYELKDRILQYYWNFQYNNIISEINNVIKINNEIQFFIDKHFNLNIHFHLLFYYRKYNYIIKNISTNKGLILLCKNNNLFLKFCSIKSINAITNGIKEDYRYITPLLIAKSGYQRYTMVEKIKKFN
jgi:hypothetical protein